MKLDDRAIGRFKTTSEPPRENRATQRKMHDIER
jgi:hypothetical protein